MKFIFLALFLFQSANTVEAAGIARRTREAQKITVLESGLASLKLRLDMIARAQKSIDAEYFIYDLDASSRLVTHALIAKAKQGVRVRLLVDTYPSYALTAAYAMAMKSAGIEVKYYNSTFLLRLYKVQFRSHRKALIIDRKEGISGGRNIADEYFDMSPEYNFLDTDLHVQGSLVKDMAASFEEFWRSELSTIPQDLKAPSKSLAVKTDKFNHAELAYQNAWREYKEKVAQAQDFITPNAEDQQNLENVFKFGGPLLAREFSTVCHDSLFIADHPVIGGAGRVLMKEIIKEVSAAKKEIYIESPYFVIQEKSSPLMLNLLSKGIKVNVMTNSLSSTDNYLTQAAFDTRIPLWTMAGMNVWMHNGGRNPKHYPVMDVAAGSRWGTHSKRAVIDGRTTIVGTFNYDPRSANINAEMAIICRDNKALARATILDIQERMSDGIKLDRLGQTSDGKFVRNTAPLSKKIKFWLAIPFSNLFSFLL